VTGTAYRLTPDDEATMLARLRCELDAADPYQATTREGRRELIATLFAAMANAIGCTRWDLRLGEVVWAMRHAGRAVAMLADALPLERCVCGRHYHCPDGWHRGEDLPCGCTPDCALDEEGDG
jgi:hypothetical protein